LTSLSLDSRSLKWVKQGRGKGSGKDYQPWLTVRDLPSAGRSHRIWGFQTQRTHHLLSDLELAAFFLFDWNPSVTDIREQYPLRLEDTIELAAQARIRHPEVRGQIQVMSTDFLVDTNKPELPRMAIQVKTSSDLSNSRTIEKLELERRYWALKEVPWYLLTEKQIPKTVTKNIAWLYPAQLGSGWDRRYSEYGFPLLGLLYKSSDFTDFSSFDDARSSLFTLSRRIPAKDTFAVSLEGFLIRYQKALVNAGCRGITSIFRH
jgi:TnsA endonuclease N terminal.